MESRRQLDSTVEQCQRGKYNPGGHNLNDVEREPVGAGFRVSKMRDSENDCRYKGQDEACSL